MALWPVEFYFAFTAKENLLQTNSNELTIQASGEASDPDQSFRFMYQW